MIISLRCVGIDVSKHMLDVFDEGIGVPERIANAPQAITEQMALILEEGKDPREAIRELMLRPGKGEH